MLKLIHAIPLNSQHQDLKLYTYKYATVLMHTQCYIVLKLLLIEDTY